MMSERVSRILARCENSLTWTRADAGLVTPLRPKVKTAPAPLGTYLRASCDSDRPAGPDSSPTRPWGAESQSVTGLGVVAVTLHAQRKVSIP